MPQFFKDGKYYKYYTQAQLGKIFAKIKNPRDKALFNLMYRYGLRRSEAGLLLKDDVDFASNKLIIRRKKGSVSREYLLFADTKRLLREYLKTRAEEFKKRKKPDIYTPLFLSRNHRGISGRMVDELWAGYVVAAKIFPKDNGLRRDRDGIFNPHALKHSLAVHLRDGGKVLDDIQYVLGHKSRNSTEIYAHVSSEKEKEIHTAIECDPHIVRM